MSDGVKHDADKLPLHLLPFDALEAITEILAFGAKKYGDRNWEKGMGWSRLFRAANGHLWAWFMGRGLDPETGKSHLWHAGCCILFLIAYELRGAGTDDRPDAGREIEARKSRVENRVEPKRDNYDALVKTSLYLGK